jgi:hypothetical protein
MSWISAKTPYGMYVMLPPDAETPAFLHPSNDRPVGIDPFFV